MTAKTAILEFVQKLRHLSGGKPTTARPGRVLKGAGATRTAQ